MPAQIIRLVTSNAAILTHIAAEVFDDAINPNYLTAFLSDPRHVMFVAVDGDLVVGMISGVEYFHPDKPPQMWINELGVSPSHRRQGLGRALMHALLQEAKQRGCIYGWLGTAQDNVVAQACFGSVPGGEPAQPFLLYEWELDDE